MSLFGKIISIVEKIISIILTRKTICARALQAKVKIRSLSRAAMFQIS